MKIILAFFLLVSAGIPALAAEENQSYVGEKDCRVFNPAPKDDERLTWSGGCKDGFADGAGVAQWYLHDQPGTRFEGEYRHGKTNGKGTIFMASGAKLVANFEDGQPVGDVDFTSASGMQYHGPWVHGRPEGKGQMKYTDGAQYDGEFKNGLRDGVGTSIFKNGDRYQGQYLKGFYEGTGTLTFTNGVRYEGTWKHGKFDGAGTMVYADGKRVAGQFKDGKRLVENTEPASGSSPASFDVQQCRPVYNKGMIAKKLQGTVQLKLNINADAKLTSASVLHSSGSQELDLLTVVMLGKCRFTAAQEGGKNVAGSVATEYEWKLPTFEVDPILATLKGEDGVLIINVRVLLVSDIDRAEAEAKSASGGAVGSLWVTNVATGKSYGGLSDGVSLYHGTGVFTVPEGIYCVDSMSYFTNLTLSYCGEPFIKVKKGQLNNAGTWSFGQAKNGMKLLGSIEYPEQTFMQATREFPNYFTQSSN